ncbi:MAG: PIG-L deacetylase family protein [Planctomycetota bacterium]
MISLVLDRLPAAPRILCLGAHCDDIEIGCGGTLLAMLERNPATEVRWIVFGSNETRRAEALRSADVFLAACRNKHVQVAQFRESFFPYHAAAIKEYFEQIKAAFAPDVILTHQRGDLHQDHRLVAELTWNTFRNHLILEYEILKYDGDLGAPNLFVPITEQQAQKKVETIVECFATQRSRQWFAPDTFYSMLRIRGVEANSPTRYAEAFYARKVVWGAS